MTFTPQQKVKELILLLLSEVGWLTFSYLDDFLFRIAKVFDTIAYDWVIVCEEQRKGVV